MGVLVLAAALLALTFQFVLQQVPTPDINYLLDVVMFGMGLTLNPEGFSTRRVENNCHNVFSRFSLPMATSLTLWTMHLSMWNSYGSIELIGKSLIISTDRKAFHIKRYKSVLPDNVHLGITLLNFLTFMMRSRSNKV